MNSHFDKSALPPAESFYRREFSKMTRQDRAGWVRVDCPWHQSKSHTSLSVNLVNGGFFCHGCQAKGGDVLAYTMKRHSLPFRRACEFLGCWRRQINNPDEARRIERQRLELEQKRQCELERQAEQKRQRLAVRERLHDLERLERQVSSELEKLESSAPGVDSPEKDLLWHSLAILGSQIRTAEQEYARMSGIEVGQ